MLTVNAGSLLSRGKEVADLELKQAVQCAIGNQLTELSNLLNTVH